MTKILATAAAALLAAISAQAASKELPKAPSQQVATQSHLLTFPGAMGWAAVTPGGRGGAILRVTNLNTDGPGSFAAAVAVRGPRIVVFEVGGVIDLDKKELKIAEPFLTIAGQTAPSPGITFIRGGIDVATHDVVIQNIRVRVGDAGAPKKSGLEIDGMATSGAAYNVIFDHNSVTWATDENMSASGLRFDGSDPDKWRQDTSHRITFSNNIIAEGLTFATHGKIEHSKGSLIHDNATDILIVNNLYAHNYERSPLLKGGTRAAFINNLIYDPGQRAIHYNLMAEEWGSHPWQTGQLSVIGTVLRAGISTPANLALIELGGYGDLQLFTKDNIAVDQIGRALPMLGRYTTAPAKFILMKAPPVVAPYVHPMPAAAVQQYVLHNAGARIWDRDHDDARLLADVVEGRGTIIASQDELHGYPVQAPTSKPFNPDDWILFDMTPKAPSVLDTGSRMQRH